MKKLLILLLMNNLYANTPLNIVDAIEILKSDNLEIKAVSLDVEAARVNKKTASGQHYGKLNFTQNIANSDDAGNVFGFKLASREASFNDFGFDEFLSQMGNTGTPAGQSALLATQPNNLNYPDSRSFFQSKLTYEVPLFTGFMISNYENIMSSVIKIKHLEKNQVINEKIYELRKSFYDMALLEGSIKNLNTVLNNIETLEETTQEMIDVGYAKKVDLLEVQAKKGNVQRLINQMNSNKKLLYHYISFLVNQQVQEIVLPSAPVSMIDLDDEEILHSNLDIQKARTGLDIKKSMLEVSQSAYYPKVGAFAEYGTADDTFLGDANDHSSYTVGAKLTWNIFNGGIDGAKIEKSRLEHLKMNSQVELAKQGIALKIAKARTEIQAHDNDIESLERELLLASEIYTNYEGRYREKLSSMSDVIIKQSEQIEKILQLQMAYNKRNERIFAFEKLANGAKND